MYATVYTLYLPSTSRLSLMASSGFSPSLSLFPISTGIEEVGREACLFFSFLSLVTFFFSSQRSDRDPLVSEVWVSGCIQGVCSCCHTWWQSWSEGAQGQVRGSQNSLGTHKTISIFRCSRCRGNLGPGPCACVSKCRKFESAGRFEAAWRNLVVRADACVNAFTVQWQTWGQWAVCPLSSVSRRGNSVCSVHEASRDLKDLLRDLLSSLTPSS